jgi:phosphoribosylamine--glycine ligase
MSPRKGDAINGLPTGKAAEGEGADVMVFHAGTVEKDGATLTSGGRVLCITALGDSVKDAQAKAYAAAATIHFDGMQYRKDIGYRAVK